MCCECIDFHAALGEVPYCVAQIVSDKGLSCSVGEFSKIATKVPKRKGKYALDDADFRLIDFAKCAG